MTTFRQTWICWMSVLYSSLLMTIAQDCSWSSGGIQDENNGLYTIGSPNVEFKVINQNPVSDGNTYQWRYNGSFVSQHYYDGSSNSYLVVLPFARGSSSAVRDGPGTLLSIVFNKLEEHDNGLSLTVSNSGCLGALESSKFNITVCEPDIQGATLVDLSSDPCGYNCQGKFDCGSGQVVTAFCLSNGTWNNTCQESTTVEPTTYRTNAATRSPTENDLESAISTTRSPASLEPTVSPDLTTSPDANAGDTSTGGGEGGVEDKSLSGGEIAGIVIGVLVGVGLIAGAIIVYIKKTA